jgi:hypothetical protein
MSTISDALQEFESVSLKELDQVALQDRMDTKYVFTRTQLLEFLKTLKLHYNILEIEGNRMFNYESYISIHISLHCITCIIAVE